MKIRRYRDMKKCERGFTVVELLVGIGLFAMVMTALTTSFLTTFRTQRSAFAFLAMQNNVRYALEIMAHEMRTGAGFTLPASDRISFTNDKGEAVQYCLQNSSIRRGDTSCDFNSPAITSSNVVVELLQFVLSGQGAGDGFQPRITITLRIVSGSLSANVQTTVEQRNLDS